MDFRNKIMIKVASSTVHEFLTQMKSYFIGDTSQQKYTNEEPLRSELLSADQMEQHSKKLAKSHKLSEKPVSDKLLKRLASNEEILNRVRNLLSDAIKDDQVITPAGEWLLDNFYLLQEQIRTSKKHLPKKYSEGLPILSSGVSAGLPRAYDIALEIISHSDGHLEMDRLNHFVQAYQSVTNFQLGELWAVPIMLRIALIENLRRVSARIAIDRINRNLADYWAKLMIESAEQNPRNLILILADMARSNPPLERAFVAEFTRQLRGKGPTLAQPLSWIEERLEETGQTSNELVQAESQKQAADQVSVSNSIGSLRLLGTMDWKEFVESNSIVEKILLQDAVYAEMDFSTRDRYRHVVEAIAKKSKKTELEVAEIAVRLSQQNVENDELDNRNSHVGYFLIDDGLNETEKLANIQLSAAESVRRKFAAHPLLAFLGPIFFITILISSSVIYKAYSDGNAIWVIVLFGLITIICASQLAISVVNFISTLVVRPHLLPRMDYAEKIPDSARTLVAVPCLLSNVYEVEELIEALEVRYLANKYENLYFGLVTDFVDAQTEKLPEDDELVELATQKIKELNKKYGREKSDLFFLFHRPRKWNPHDRVWMGYERKRGKLGDLNGLLRGNAKDAFSVVIGELNLLQTVRYVTTLDADTQLPRDAAWKIIGTISHPLNRAYYDEHKQRVTEGYGILQPRVSVSMPGADSSLYAVMNGNEPGIDPYTRATSDVYQDLFDEGSFIGKGIYEVDIFEKAFKGKFPENRILSHDLLEGCYARSGLLSDVQLYEKYPVRYDTDMKRQHRWIRGDWQIAAWCLPFVPYADKHWRKNPLSGLSRWKIFDNIRRSLVPPAFTIFLLLGWTVLHSAAIWTLIISSIIILPVVISSVWDLFRKPKALILIQHLLISGRSAGNTAIKTLFILICLPYEAYVSIETALISSWRILISKKKLLEWTPAAKVERLNHKTLPGSYLYMWMEPTVAVFLFFYLSYTYPNALIIAGPILTLWLLAPLITWWVSKPLVKQIAELDEEQINFLHKQARKIWYFFEEFVTEKENWLPPDNFQEVPVSVIAHRTSPTNIGLSLLANLSANDFGYITVGELMQRTSDTFNTLQKMEKYQGHFYNWYDTETLKPLWPRYISTVDSGNLAGHLLTLRQGFLGLINQPVIGQNSLSGIRDTMKILCELVGEKDELSEQVKTDLQIIADADCSNLKDIKSVISELSKNYFTEQKSEKPTSDNKIEWWKHTLSVQIQQCLNELQTFIPWLFTEENIPEKFEKNIPTLYELSRIDILSEINNQNDNISSEERQWLLNLQESMTETSKQANRRIVALEILAQQCNELSVMEYDFLYNKTKNLLTIGYNVEEHKVDNSYYDLLASEVRLGVFVGVSQGKMPQESWFALGRLLTSAGGRPILLSWSGSMFEYLMPLLIMPSYENTLLEQTDKAVVERQIEYGKQRNVPWGISESCYNMVDVALNYQYRAFGVPGLGLKRGLGEDLVIAPYATFLSLMVLPEKACENLQLMSKLGFENNYGFYEAIDYTPSRLPRGQNNVVVQSYMAHHQGMSMLSIGHLLHNKPMQRRFESEAQFKATLLLLQERVPKGISLFSDTTDMADIAPSVIEADIRIISTPNTALPEVQLLSNGNYHVMVTNSGGGYSRWRDIEITRWREDATRDNWGTFCYIRDLETGNYWSTAYQPTLQRSKVYEAAFSQGRADFHGLNNEIETHTEIVVSPEDDIEMRRIHITNRSSKRKTIDVTSYAEVVIQHAAADAAHPAFGNLFVQTEILSQKNAILCTRRPRSVEDKMPWMLHLMKVHNKEVEEVSYETDRSAFIGRGNTVANPQSMTTKGMLTNSQGSVLDPVVSIRYKIILEPEEMIAVDMIIGIGETREICQSLTDKYQDKHHKDRVFELAWTHNQVVLRQINATESEAQLYTRLANSVLYINPALRADSGILIQNHKGQPGLWPYAISGDLPIVLLKIEEHTDIELVIQLIQAHTYWRLKGLIVDLVIWNDGHGGYRQVLQNQITGLIAAQMTDRPGGIFVRNSDQISNEDRILFQTVARVIISSEGGTLADHVNRKAVSKTPVPLFTPIQSYVPSPSSLTLPKDIVFYNGFGGFSENGKEYLIEVSPDKRTPAPWVNVIANSNIGTVVSESGQSYTWSENAHEMRLTPWENDPISDLSGEAFYMRDEESGYFWSPIPFSKNFNLNYITRHGFGYSIIECEDAGIHSETCFYVDINASIKFTVLRLKNNSGKARKISVTGYTEWVLGELRSKSAMYIVTELDTESGAIFAKNPYSMEFNDRIAFFDADGGTKTFTGDRNEFIGRNGSLRNPAAMTRLKLSGKIGIGLDPCAAIQVSVDLAEGEEKEIIFKLGEGKNLGDASSISRQFRTANSVHQSLEKVKTYWEQTISSIQIETPDTSVNLLANGWLTYQILSSRMWGRSGYYQSGGAYGFRDQLQDTIALIHIDSKLTRNQILLCASKQFKEGDVQHWWHPPVGRGVRTRISDDYLWLPFVTAKYILGTGDITILNEPVHFLEGRLLNHEEESYYELNHQSNETSSLYEHCVKAVKHGLRFGVHGLPLMGTGDWNDGMDKVGREGKGESVWLAFFLYDVLNRFIPVAQLQNDAAFVEQCKTEAKTLKENIEKNGWSGEWYQRAYFDNGTPLGNISNPECQIDSIAQSWSVLSGAGESQHTITGMASADKRLVNEERGLIQLLDPPFDKSELEPGYIKGYVPGVRENGGQYTHAAIWMIMAQAKLGNNKRAWELLEMINPVNHGKSYEDISIYKVEPYVMAADVYAVSPHTGRGGWTWYTGSAGWMYQLIIGSLLGINQEADKLSFAPCIPADWESFKVRYRYKNTFYQISFNQKQDEGEMVIIMDGKKLTENEIILIDDNIEHAVEVNLFLKESLTSSKTINK